jgi:DNA-binding CsgD family transcriptional regulator
VIRGEAGIGKTALLQYCARQAFGCRIALIAGAESELEMPFAALHQLCRPMFDTLAALPEPQAQVLRVAFGLTVGNTPDRFVVGVAVLNLLAEVATRQPLVCLVDDAQWLDEPSRQVLEFVGRRLLADAVALVFSVRETGEEQLIPTLPELTLNGLPDDAARALLAEVTTGHLDQQVRDRIVAETRGNPLALLDLPKAMNPAELAGGFATPAASTPSGQLQDHYLHRVNALPEATRQLALLAAADPTGDSTLLWRAAETFSIGRGAAAPAASAELLEVDSRVRFRHPLVRSAAYAAATPEARSEAHRALAAATDPLTDPERRLWHLAAAASGFDEAVASELERTAGRARARAGLAAAAAFLQRSVELTADKAQRADRALAAAHAHLHAGAFDSARGLLFEADAVAVDDLQRARVEQLRGHVEAAAEPGREAPVRLLRAARRLESLDVRLARETYLQAWWAAVLAGQFAAPGGDIREVSEAARLAPRTTDPRPCDLLLDGLAMVITDGRAAAAPSLRLALDQFVTEQVSADDWIRWGRSATTAAFALWDVDNWIELSRRQVKLARASGALASLVLALNLHGVQTTLRGDFDTATVVVAEQRAVKEATGIRMASYGARLLDAYQGRPTDPRSHVSAIANEVIEPGDGYGQQIAGWATAILNNGLGRYADAFAAAQDLVAYELSFAAPLALSELIEAAVRSGRTEAAADALKRLVTLTVAGSDWSAGIEARARALLCDCEDADRWYSESISCLARTPLRTDLARAHLLYGEWLRRESRRVDARQQLRTAHNMFTAMGAEAFAERTRRELIATGEKVRRREVGGRNNLTPQELHIARLARDGHTNPEIGAELFISARTVEWHLRNVYTKLGISKRRELKDAVPTGGRPAQAAQGID